MKYFVLDKILFRDGINQILVGISSSPMTVFVQCNGRLLISVFHVLTLVKFSRI
jgi:hypothetical protein